MLTCTVETYSAVCLASDCEGMLELLMNPLGEIVFTKTCSRRQSWKLGSCEIQLRA